MTLTELQDRLSLYLAAERTILTTGQSYTFGSAAGDRANTRANLTQVQAEIRSLQQQIATHPESTQRGRLSHSQAYFGGRR